MLASQQCCERTALRRRSAGKQRGAPLSGGEWVGFAGVAAEAAGRQEGGGGGLSKVRVTDGQGRFAMVILV
jgi:hypothetical protein